MSSNSFSVQQEVERKFLVRKISDRKPDEVHSLEQFYVEFSKEFEHRIRSIDGKVFVETKKIGAGLSREERERFLNKEEFLLLKKNAKTRIAKTRSVYGRWEVDQYAEDFGLPLVAECELKNESEPLPSLEGFELLEEVTEDARFKNKNLAKPV